jgi:hypothetical protein
MHVLGLEQDMIRLGATDEPGYRQQDASLLYSKNPASKGPASKPTHGVPKAGKIPTSQTNVVEVANVSEERLKNFPLYSLTVFVTEENAKTRRITGKTCLVLK